MTRRTCYRLLMILWLIPFNLHSQGGEGLPQFAFSDSEGKKVTDVDFRNNRPLIVFYFEPTCTHCQQQAEWVTSSIDAFKDVDLLWVAWEETDQLESFQQQFFPQDQNVVFVIDVEQSFDSLFGFSQIPTVFVYDQQNLLLKKFKKESRSEKLLKTLGRTP